MATHFVIPQSDEDCIVHLQDVSRRASHADVVPYHDHKNLAIGFQQLLQGWLHIAFRSFVSQVSKQEL